MALLLKIQCFFSIIYHYIVYEILIVETNRDMEKMENLVNFYFMEKIFILKPRGHMENLEILKKIRHTRIFRPVLETAGA